MQNIRTSLLIAITAGALLIISCVQACDKDTCSSTPFVIFLGTQKEEETMKRNIMAQWMNLHRNNSFVNRMQ